MADLNVPEVFFKLGELVIARGQAPLTRYEHPLHVPIDDQWAAWVNGGKYSSRIRDAGEETMARDLKVPGFTAALFFNGWLAGLCDPGGGQIAAGAAANEETLLEAIDIAIAAEKEADA